MPTATATITPPQQRFIAGLAQERDVPTGSELADRVRAAAAGTLPRRGASLLIEQLQERPRVAARSEGQTVPRPSDQRRAGRMLLAGGIEATVTLDDGRHVTINIRTRTRSGRGWTNAAPGQEGARTIVKVLGMRVGHLNIADTWRLELRTSRPEYRTAVHAVLNHAAGAPLPAGAKRVQEASRCGRCLRHLTDPISIDRGVGPECYGRETGSRHVNAQNSPVQPPVPAHEQAASLFEATADALTTPTPPVPVFEVGQWIDGGPIFGGPVEITAINGRNYSLRWPHHAEASGDDWDVESWGHRDGLQPVRVVPAPEGVVPVVAQTVERAPVDEVQQHLRVARARDLIAEALDSYCTDEDRDFAMRVFNQLAAR